MIQFEEERLSSEINSRFPIVYSHRSEDFLLLLEGRGTCPTGKGTLGVTSTKQLTTSSVTGVSQRKDEGFVYPKTSGSRRFHVVPTSYVTLLELNEELDPMCFFFQCREGPPTIIMVY